MFFDISFLCDWRWQIKNLKWFENEFMVHRLFDPGSFLKLWSSLGHYWTWVFDIINSSLFSRVPPNSITFHIDFIFILMYVSIISQKFFTPIIEKFFTPLWKVFYPLDDHFHSISQLSWVWTNHTHRLGVWIRMVVGDGVKNFSGG